MAPDYFQDEDDVDFNPEEFEDGEEINDLDQLWEYADYDEEDLYEYEFHGTGDTG